MSSQTIRVLPLNVPGNSLSAWLAAHHPDLFLAMFKQAQAAQVARKIQLRGLRGLADDPGTTTTFDDTSSPAADVGLQQINVDTESIVPANLLSDSTDTGSSFLSSIGNGLTSAGSTVAGALGSVGSGVLSALGSVGSYLTSSTGLNNLTGLAKTYFATQGAVATAQTQQAVLQAQASRAATGQTAAPITYTRNAAGNLVPVYATQTPQGTVYQPLSSAGIGALTPSSLSVFVSQYGLWIALGGLGLFALSSMRGR